MEDGTTKKRSQDAETEKNDAIAKALSTIYKKALSEEDLQTQHEDASYYRKLARPRSVKYLELVSKEMQITERVSELYKKLEENNSCTQTESEWWQADVQKVQQEEIMDNSAILEEIAQLKAELAGVRTALEAEMPVGHGRLGMIYCSDKEGKLIDLGAISGPGTPFQSVDELLQQTNPRTEQEKQQWIKGNDAFWDVRGECLVVEIYLTAICVVFDDGSVKCYRD